MAFVRARWRFLHMKPGATKTRESGPKVFQIANAGAIRSAKSSTGSKFLLSAFFKPASSSAPVFPMLPKLDRGDRSRHAAIGARLAMLKPMLGSKSSEPPCHKAKRGREVRLAGYLTSRETAEE